MIDEWLIGNDLEGSSHGLIKVPPWHLPEGMEETMKNLRIVTADLAENQTKYLQFGLNLLH
jgi:hypothetical protein